MKLKLFMRKLQLYDEYQKPVWYSGLNPNSLNVVQGYLPDNEWKDYSNFIDNLNEFSTSWKVRSTENTKSISNIEKSISNELQFIGEAFEFVKLWLIDHVASPLNGIEVKIEIENCGDIVDLIIKSDGISYCTDSYCNIDANLKQKDDFYTCIYSTLITDNHMGMFDGKYQHPRFSYCNEFRPTFLLSLLFQILGVIGIVWVIFGGILTLIKVALQVVLTVVRIITFGGAKKLRRAVNNIPDIKDMKNTFLELFVDLFGCGREHPAPLIRDYITNVCSKCGIKITQDSIPLFFNPDSDYYNLTWFSAETKKGVDKDSDNFWIPDNDPLLTLDMLLDKLKKVFNAKWFVKGGILYFDHVDKLENHDYVFDFIGEDKKLIIDNICFSWNEVSKPAYMRVGYSVDPFDNLTSDSRRRYNDIVEFNKPINPILSGYDDKTLIDFAPTRFRNDGIEKDYVSQTLNPLGQWGDFLAVLFTGPTFLVSKNEVKKRMDRYKYSVIMQNNTTMLPRLIIWDGQTKKAAKPQRKYQYDHLLPSPNDKYNTEGIPYNKADKGEEQYDSFLKENTYLINYPMFFDAQYKGNLWDFHQSEDPRINPAFNKEFELSIPLCCENLQRLNIFNDSGNINIERKVKIDAGEFYKDGIIKEIELNFDSRNNRGRHIKIKGRI